MLLSFVARRRVHLFTAVAALFLATTSASASAPEHCADLYSGNGAVPGDASCPIRAATAPTNLSNFECGSSRYVDAYCASGAAPDGPTPGDFAAATNAGDPSSCNGSGLGAGNPIHLGTGNKFQRETDVTGWSPFAADFTRYYNSQREHADGAYWAHTWQRRVDVDGFVYVDADGNRQTLDDTLALVRPDGRTLIFYRTGEYELAARAESSPDDIPSVGTDQYPLTWTGSAWRYRNEAGEREYYDEDGRLLRITDTHGLTRTIEHDGEGRVARVVDPYGRALVFDYDDEGRLVRVTDPGGQAVTYGYDSAGRLHTRTDRSGATRTYHYGENDAPAHALTGITAATGERFATWTYDDEGRAVTSEHAGGAERVEIDYRDEDTVAVTDAHGGTRVYTLDTIDGRQFAARIDGDVCSSCGSVREREHDERGLLTRAVDAEGHVTTYSYNSAGLQTSRTEAKGTAVERTITTDWDHELRRPVRITEPERQRAWSYDDHGRVLNYTITDTVTGEARTTTYAYHPDAADGTPGRLASIDGPRTDVADITTFEYDAEGNPSTITNAAGHVTRITAHDAYGRPTEVRDPNGLTTRLAHDAEGRLVEHDQGGRITNFAYDANGNLDRITRPDGGELHYEYDAAQRLTAITDETGARVTYTLDGAGNRTEQRVTAASGAVAREHRQVFDELGNLIRTIGAQGQATYHQYDANANRTATTDPTGATTHRAFDALDRLVRQTNALGGVTAFSFDAHDRITAVTDPNGYTTRYTWNGFGERVRTDSPDAGTTSYAYNASGDLIEETDARGYTTRYTRDALGRPTEMTAADGSVTIFTWDEGEHGIGRLARIDEHSGTTAWRYNAHGDITEKTQTADGVSLTTAHEYDHAGRRTAMVYPSGTRVTYEYEAARITGLAVDGEPGLTDIDHEPFGPVSGWTWGDGRAHERDYDRDGRLIAHSMPGGQRHLGYTADGQVDAITGPDTIRTHDYDALKRLTRTEATEGSWSYDYDANGNRLSHTGDGAVTSHSHAPDSNRLASASGAMAADYTYTAAGHMTGDGTHTYQYGPRGRLKGVDAGDTATYSYNALGQRIAKRATTGDAPDYTARAEAAEAAAQALRDEADDLDDQRAEARQAAADAEGDAAQAQNERDQYQAEAQHHTRNAERQRHRATQWQRGADAYQDRADAYRERITSSPRSWWQHLRNALYRAFADTYARIADWFQGWADQATAGAKQAEEQADAAQAQADAAEAHLSTAQAEAESQAQRAEDLQQQAHNNRQAAADQQQQAEEYRRLADANDSARSSTTRFVYGPNDRLIGRYTSDGTTEREYIRLGATPVATIDADGTIHYIHTDHLGTPRAVSQPDGEVVWRWLASPFGKGEPDEDANGDGKTFTFNLRFPGQYYDAETGRHYNYFRDYDPSIGRYTTPDPIGLAGGDVNLYGYVLNDPVNMIDPAGLFGDMVQASNPQAQAQVAQAERETGREMTMTVRQMGRSRCFESCVVSLAIGTAASESVLRTAGGLAESAAGVCKAVAQRVIPVANVASTAHSATGFGRCIQQCY